MTTRAAAASVAAASLVASLTNIDGVDVSSVFFGNEFKNIGSIDNRTIFFWRDGFSSGPLPLPQPFGRFDVVAVKMLGRYKLWFSTKSSHYNDDEEAYHDPPLIFDVIDDPAEASPLGPSKYQEMIKSAKAQVEEHKASVDWTYPLCLDRDSKYLPCSDESIGCRTAPAEVDIENGAQIAVD